MINRCTKMENEQYSKGDFITAKVRSIKQTSVFERFTQTIQKSLHFFQKKNIPDTQLVGRIQELNRTSKELLAELISIKTELQSQVDPALFSHIETVVDPLIRDITRIHTTIDHEKHSSPATQVHFFRRYNEWIEKARNWIKLKGSHNDKLAIEEAVVKHLFEDFVERIGRDFQVIQDYQHHLVEGLDLKDEEADSLQQDIAVQLEPYLSSLSSLKKAPGHLSFKTLASWKDNIDKRRQKYFDGALFIIDKCVQDYRPAAEIKEEHEHLVEIFTQMSELEESVPNLKKELEDIDLSDEDLRDSLESRLRAFEEAADKLNMDLRLTPELIDRLQTILEQINDIRTEFLKA